MNTIKAAELTLALAREQRMDWMYSNKSNADYDHLSAMLHKMKTEEMSETKKSRWLGWMQASVYVMCEDIVLGDMKAINLACS